METYFELKYFNKEWFDFVNLKNFDCAIVEPDNDLLVIRPRHINNIFSTHNCVKKSFLFKCRV
jgi:hypothetical protein